MYTYIDRKAIKQNKNLSVTEIKWKVVVGESNMGSLRPLQCSKAWPGEWWQIFFFLSKCFYLKQIAAPSKSLLSPLQINSTTGANIIWQDSSNM